MALGSRDAARRSTIRPFGIAGTVAGVILFGWYLRAVGLADVTSAITRIGAGFVLVLVLSGLRLALRAAAWVQCVEDGRLRFRPALAAFLAGDALGNVTPLGPVASEGLKALLARRHVGGLSALSSIALENLFYALTVAVVLVVGVLAFLLAFDPDPATRTSGVLIALATGLAFGVVCWLLYGRSRAISRGARWLAGWGVPPGLRARAATIEALDDRIARFSVRHPRRVAMVLLLEGMFQAASVGEVYLLLLLLVGPAQAGLLQALVLETVNRITMVLFKFVPLRVGVDEAGSGLVSQALSLGSVTGVAIALTRKARTVFWSGLGLAILVREGFSVGRAVKQAAEVADDETVSRF